MKAFRHRHDPQKALVGFVVGEVHYGLGIADVAQIVNPLPMTVLPHLPDAVVGVADHRGIVLPIISLRIRFGLPNVADSRRSKWILVSIAGQPAALSVDAVTDVFGTAGEELRPSPGLGRGDERRGIIGVINYRNRLTFVLDPHRLRPLLDEFAQKSEQFEQEASVLALPDKKSERRE
jgi:purine-binding chemotaxis protein CheW